MAEEKPFVPPFRKPVSEFKTPDQTIIFVTELVNRDDPAYTANAPVKRGTLYKDIVGGDPRLSVTHPLLYFCGERKFQLSDQYVIWDWSSDEMAHSSYNADITYELEAAGFPVYTRTYTIRRDDYEQNPTIPIGSTLDALIGVTIINGGEDYTFATGEIEGKNATIEFVVSSGVIISGVVTNEGTGVLPTDVITITGDGALAEIVPMVQPTSAVLTSQKKEELPDDNPWANEFVKVTRVYQTLPGPTIHSTQLHVDGKVVDVATTLKVASTITSGETLVGTTWTITTKTQDDNQYTGKEIVITRTVPGNPVPYTKVEDDGKVTTGTRTLKDTTLITTAETLVGTTWTHQYKEFLTTRLTIGEEASDLVSWEVVESRPIPGNVIPSTRLDDDGIKINVESTLIEASTFSTFDFGPPYEIIDTGQWKRKHLEPVSDLVGKAVVEIRDIPGANIVEETIDERDGAVQVVVRSMVDNATFIAISPKEYIDSGFYIKIESKAVSGSSLVVWQSVTTRIVPGPDVVKTVIDADGDIVTETRNIVEGPPTLVTTITTTGGVYTKTFGEPITDIISWEVVQVKATQATLDSYEAEIPDLLPEEFRPQVPVTTHEETLIGDAVAITLPMATGVLFEKNAQIDFNTYRHTLRGRFDISLPQTITNREITTEFGGGRVNRILTLDLNSALVLEFGLTVLSSEIRKIDDQSNGLAVRTTRQLVEAAWPILDSTHVDETYGVVIDITKQVVDAGATGGVSGGIYTEVKSIDKWRSITIASQLDVDSLPEDVQWFSGQSHSFVPELSDAVIEWAEGVCGCADKFAAVLQANLTQYRGQVKTRITDQFYNGPPPDDVTITQFFPQSHTFGFSFAAVCGCDDEGTARVTAIAPQFHIPDCLHDDLTLTIGLAFSWTFPATSPAVLPHGSYIMLAPHIERWRFGVFRRVLTEVLVP